MVGETSSITQRLTQEDNDMNIVKELNINKNPNAVPNGSFVFAKNIKVSPDNSHITNEEGLSLAFSSYVKGKIVGIIPCIKEVVILSYLEDDKGNGQSFIYRAKENENTGLLDLNDVATAWVYSGGKIVGDYTYNVNNELIIAIAESGVTRIKTNTSEDGNEIKIVEDVEIPLRTINLNRSTEGDNIESYSVCPNIPISNLKLVEQIPGSAIPNGIYQFYIRYEIAKDVYTNWFIIGIPYYAIDIENKTIINHTFDVKGATANNVNCVAQYNADNKDCPYNFKFHIDFDNTYGYISYQIGYILRHEDINVARIWRKFSTYVKDFIFDATNVEEANIDDMVANSFNLFNVKSVCNYENRLYVANYTESNYNVNLQTYANGVKAKMIYKTAPEAGAINKTEEYIQFTISWSTNKTNAATIDIPYNSKNPLGFTSAVPMWTVNIKDYPQLRRFFTWIVLENEDVDKFENLYIETTDIKTYKVDNLQFLFFIDNANTLQWILKETTSVSDKGIVGSTNLNNTPTKLYVNCYELVNGRMRYSGYAHMERICVAKSTYNKTITTSTNINDAVRTLMPNSVYNFFIHYVRKDGTYTNGYQLNNDVSNLFNNVTAIKTSGNNANINTQLSELKTLKETVNKDGGSTSNYEKDFDSLLNVPALQDKYIYEVVNTCSAPNDSAIIAKGTDFGYYENYNGDKLFKTGSSHSLTSLNQYKLYTIGVGFTGIEIPDGYVGFFFSYEEPENTNNYQAYCASTSSDKSLFKASEVETAACNYNGSIYIPEYKITSNGYDYPKTKPDYINNIGIVMSNSINDNNSKNTINAAASHGGIVINLKTSSPEIGEVGNILSFNRNVYCKKDKRLIPFGPVSYGDSGKVYSYADSTDSTFANNLVGSYDFNYPAFFVNDKSLIYDRPVYISDTGKLYDVNSENIISKDYSSKKDGYAHIVNFTKFSRFNTNAVSIKKEPEYLIGVMGDETTNEATHQRSVNTVVRPINATDLIQLKGTYIETHDKVFTNFKEQLNYSSQKQATIRRSDVIGDESLNNSWRNFRANNYKVLSKNKGNITNIVGVGSAFLIHTENTLFMINKENMLKTADTNIQLSTPDLFDVEPIEVFTSNHGYGGLQHYNAWTINSNGYWFLDADNKRVYNFDNNHLTDCTSDILNWINDVVIDDANLVTDFTNSRVIMCISYHNETQSKGNYITLSFNMISKKYVSLHDYKFSLGTNTKNHCYFYYAPEGATSSNLYCFHKNARLGDYGALSNATFGFPTRSTNVEIQKEDGSKETPTIYSSVFDIIINDAYNIPKCINSISYILNKIYSYYSDKITRMAEPVMGNGTYGDITHYSGDIIRIYSDSNDTGNLDISTPDKVNQDGNYTTPYYDKGVWNFNYIRNYISKDLKLKEILDRFNIDETAYNNLDDNKKAKIIGMATNAGDERNLVYGRYFVIRFIFTNVDNIPFRFEDLEVNYSKY